MEWTFAWMTTFPGKGTCEAGGEPKSMVLSMRTGV
jgi:hypothetical protein